MGHPHVPTGPAQSNEVVRKDAKNRSWRTFVQNAGIDVAAVLVPLLYTALTEAQWTKVYWVVTFAALGKTAGLTVLAYIMRYTNPPSPPTVGAQGQ